MLIKNTRALVSGAFSPLDIRVSPESGAITETGRGLAPVSGESSIDAGGLTCFPGLVDLHVHFRDPGLTYKEDIYTGCAAASVGGFTSVAAMPNTKPVTDTPELVKYALERSSRAGCRLLPLAAVTKGQKSGELVDFDALHAAGAAGFSDDGSPVSTPMMLAAMRFCAGRGYLILSHPEDRSVYDPSVISAPPEAEDLGIDRDITLAGHTGARLHLCHVSTKWGMESVRQAKKRGINITAETCPHYFTLTEDDLAAIGSNARMSPPLRTPADRSAVLDAIADGTVDCISTDHAPHSEEEKARPLAEAPNGIIGLQTSLPLGVTELVRQGVITLERLAALMSVNPSRIIGLPPAGIAEGAPADLTLFDPDESFVFTSDMIRSKSRNSPFIGRRMYGSVKMTVLRGSLMYRAHDPMRSSGI